MKIHYTFKLGEGVSYKYANFKIFYMLNSSNITYIFLNKTMI